MDIWVGSPSRRTSKCRGPKAGKEVPVARGWSKGRIGGEARWKARSGRVLQAIIRAWAFTESDV